MIALASEDPLALATVAAIREGDLDTLRRLLADHAGLATARLGPDRHGGTRTLLHIATDWPGHFPLGPETVALLVDAGSDVNAPCSGPHTETPLHWAASSDDVGVLDALLDAGADIEARGAVIGGGTPLADATAFGQWAVARRLIERGAASTLWESAAMGLLDRVEQWCSTDPLPTVEDVTASFWGACHGGHLRSAAYLLERGADIDWVGWDDLTPLDVAERSESEDVVAWLQGKGARSAGTPG